jgi:hypothetical protein
MLWSFSVRMSAGMTVQIEVFRDFLQILQANAGVVPRLSHCGFPPNPSSLSVILHSTLHSPAIDSAVEEPTHGKQVTLSELSLRV